MAWVTSLRQDCLSLGQTRQQERERGEKERRESERVEWKDRTADEKRLKKKGLFTKKLISRGFGVPFTFFCLIWYGDTEYFDIVAGVLQGDTLAPYLFIICLDYVLRTSIDKIKENGFELTKKKSRRYPATTITDADYADDIAILANTPDQAETLLHSLERAAASIGIYVNAHKTEYMCYNQTGDISTLEGTPLKLVDKFTYLGSSVESTEKDIETRLAKAWKAINRLSIIWKSDLTD